MRDDRPTMRDDRPMGPLENWTWVLAEARTVVDEPCRAPMVAIRAYEVWAHFIAKRPVSRQHD